MTNDKTLESAKKKRKLQNSIPKETKMKTNKRKKTVKKKIKQIDEIFCPSCGEIIKKDALICVKCGVQINKSPEGVIPKSKTTAILLAIFLSFWTWLYTYKRDAWKFWLNLVLSLVTIGFWQLVAWPWSIIDVVIRPESYYKEFPNAQ